MTISISLSDAFHNKKLTGDKATAFDSSFKAQEISVSGFIRHVLDGKAWAVGTYKDNHRSKGNFLQSDVLALDLDDLGVSVPDALKNAAISRYAALIHPSPTSSTNKPKTRIVFVLDRPIAVREKWELAQRACLYYFADLQPDMKCKDGARFYYGCNKGEAHERPDTVLPLAVVAQWVEAYKAAQETEQKQLDVAPAQPDKPTDAANAYAEAAFTNVCNELANTPEGSRNDMLNKAAYKLYSMARGNWPGITDARIDNALRVEAVAIGLKEHEIAATLRSAKNAAPPKYMNLKDKHEPLANFDLQSAIESGHVYQQATMNSLQSTLHKMMAAAKSEELSGDELQTMAETFNTAVDSLMSMSGKIKVVSAIDANKQAAAMYNAALQNPSRITGFKSNLSNLDFLIGGFADGQSYTFQGATGTGKTQLSATLAYNFGLDAPGMIISMENTEPVFIMRMWAYLAGIPFGDIKRGGKVLKDSNGVYTGFRKFNDDEQERIRAAQGSVTRMVGNGTQMLEGNPLSPAVIRAFVRQQSHCKWLIVDSLNNVALPYYASEYENVSQAALLCEQIATTYNIPVINTVQIGRNTKGRATKEPGIHDARGSGIVEEKAAVVVGMYNHWYHVAQGDIDVTADDYTKYPEGTVRFRPTKLRDGEAGKPTNLKYLGGCGYYNR